MSTIILGVTGSIAAYKAADITGRLREGGHEVFVVMTKAAREFVTPLTLATLSRNPVLTDLSEEQEGGWKPGHIDLADRAQLLLVAPASADAIAKLANGFADDALGAVALATRAPLLIAPAMNGKMWEHPATRHNTAMLVARGATFCGPVEGMLACGYEGTGRLAPVDEIVSAATAILAPR
jgi:phosphopantothenoylcysteine synthetase/decarboxylase